MDMMGKIRRLHFRDRLSFSEIARRTGLSRNTVKKWIKAPEGSQPRYRRGASAGKLAAWHEALIQALRADARRPKHERRSGRALHAQIKAVKNGEKWGQIKIILRLHPSRSRHKLPITSNFVAASASQSCAGACFHP